jgi:hypothetical protein
MKMTKKDHKANEAPTAIGESDEKYPYGLTISLENESIAKLGMSPLPKVGESFQLDAKVMVKSVRESERINGKPEKSVELQITHMYLGKGNTKDKTKQANALYES